MISVQCKAMGHSSCVGQQICSWFILIPILESCLFFRQLVNGWVGGSRE